MVDHVKIVQVEDLLKLDVEQLKDGQDHLLEIRGHQLFLGFFELLDNRNVLGLYLSDRGQLLDFLNLFYQLVQGQNLLFVLDKRRFVHIQREWDHIAALHGVDFKEASGGGVAAEVDWDQVFDPGVVAVHQGFECPDTLLGLFIEILKILEKINRK